ncbi:ankycorbin-like isoform X2 [Lethenteron reissneri]|uniref:ankycorbin-like isoform X2 n=1 Tax=Lethenteron reissneri TaxID=7753 RepID=UPI002AB741F5|nr:ankycorbin-like isoform X2 [Lethenteron reissneri]
MNDPCLPRALHIAVVQQNVQMVNKIVQLFHMGRISLDVYNHLHQSPLHLAIITGQEALVAVLLSGGASPAALDRHGMNAVHLACSAGQTDVLTLLLAQPACRALLNSHDFAGMTPLHVAVKGSCISAVSRLLENQVNVDALDWKNGASALIYAVENDNKEIVELLIKNGANVNQQTYGGNAAVHVASGRGLLEITCLLVRHGANVGLKNTQNDNAYTVTTNQQVIDILKGRNAKLHVTGSDKCSLHSQHGGNSPNKPRDLPKGPATTSMLINRASQTDEPTMSVPSSPRQNSPVQNTRQPVDGSKQGEETSASNTKGSVTGAPSTGEATESIGHRRIIMKRATAKTTRPCVVVSSADSRDEVKVKLQAAIRSRVATATFKTTPGTLSQRAQVPSIVTLHPVTPVIKVVTTSRSTASKAANASHTLTKTTPSVKESYISFAKEWLSTAKVTPPPKCIATSVITKRLELETKQSSKDPCTLQLEPTQSSKDPCTLQLEPTQSSKDPCTLQLEPTQSSKDPCTLQLEPKQSSEDPCTLQLEPKQSSKDPCTLQLEPTQSSKDPCTLQLEPKQSSEDPCTLQLEPKQSSKDPCTLQLEPKQSSKDPCTLQLEPTQSSEDPCTLQLEPKQSSEDPCTLQLEPKQSSKNPCTLQLEPKQSSEDPCTLQLEPKQSSEDPCTLQLEPKQSSKYTCTLQLEPTQSSEDTCTLQLEPKQSSEDPCTLQLEPTQSSKDPCTLQLEHTQSSEDPCKLEPKQSSKEPRKSIISKDVVTTQAS